MTNIAELLQLILYICFSISCGYGRTLFKSPACTKPCSLWAIFYEHPIKHKSIYSRRFSVFKLPETFNSKRNETKDVVAGFKVPTILDTLPKTNLLKETHAIEIAYPPIETIASFSDSCILSDEKANSFDPFLKRNEEQRADGLQLLVDTSQTVTLSHRNFSSYYSEDTTNIYYKGLPCFVYNESARTKWLYVQDSHIIAIQEAFDSDYTWRPIQIWYSAFCGNSYYRIPLKPRQYLLFKIPLYKGDYYTDIRLKLYSNDVVYYSNEYKAWINYKQFDLPKKLMNEKGHLRLNLNFLNTR